MNKHPDDTGPGGAQDPGDRSPLFRSWKGWYILLIIVLLAEVLAFCLLTQYFS